MLSSNYFKVRFKGCVFYLSKSFYFRRLIAIPYNYILFGATISKPPFSWHCHSGCLRLSICSLSMTKCAEILKSNGLSQRDLVNHSSKQQISSWNIYAHLKIMIHLSFSDQNQKGQLFFFFLFLIFFKYRTNQMIYLWCIY